MVLLEHADVMILHAVTAMHVASVGMLPDGLRLSDLDDGEPVSLL